MNKFQRIMSDATVKSLINAIIKDGEIGDYAYPLRDAILETGVVKECRDSLILLAVAHEVYDRTPDCFPDIKGCLGDHKNLAKLTEPPMLISVFDFEHCCTRLVGGEWSKDVLFWGKGTRYVRRFSPTEPKFGPFVARYSAPSILRELRQNTPIKPIPVE